MATLTNPEIASLRAQLERVTAERDELRAAMDVALADYPTAEEQAAEDRGSRFWFAAWKNGNRHLAERQIELAKVRGWLDETGREATRLQTELSAAHEEIGALTRVAAEAQRDREEADRERDDAMLQLDREGRSGG